MKYLVTGGCGFLGSNLAAQVLKQGDELVVFDSLYRFGASHNLDWLRSQGDFRFIHADIRNINDVERTIKEAKPDVIFHLVGQVAMATSLANPRFDFEVNVVGSFNVLESVRQYSPNSTIIYSSTNKVYGDLEYLHYKEGEKRYFCSQYPNGLDESISIDFHSPYGCSKGAADQYMLDYARMFGLNTVVFRHSSIYGGRQFSTFDQGWIGWFCQKALEQKKDPHSQDFTIAGNGKQVRDVLYASDIVSCYANAVAQIENVRGQAFNIGGSMENSLSLLELFNLLEQLLDVKLHYEKLAPRISDQKIFVADVSKAKQLMGWEPKVSSKEGVSNMLDWLQRRSLAK
ncbi:GDP-mannose 4,6-dehydratase [Microcoleus sp. B4-D4]|uniref:GDP-mannose 4,6-dehydratase n=1 Tax=Microcoleus sp. B4-D4 TaxID=2818667 RepID=UPI002FCF7376